MYPSMCLACRAHSDGGFVRPLEGITVVTLEQKALRLAEFSGAASLVEIRRIIDKGWQSANADRVGYLLAGE